MGIFKNNTYLSKSWAVGRTSHMTNNALKQFFTILIYYLAMSHKDWELLNSQIWLAEIDIDRGLDFPI